MSTEVAPPPVVPPGAAPEVKTWANPDGTLNPTFYEKLPEDVAWMKDTLSKYKTREELVRGFANASSLAGKKGLIPLPDNAPPEAKADRKALLDGINGVPKETKDYGIERPKEIPEGQWNQGLAENFVKWAYENSVSPGAAKKLIAVQMEAVKGQLAQQAQYETNFWAEEQKNFEANVRTMNLGQDRATALVERGAIALGLDLANPKTQTLLKGADARMMAMKYALATGEDSTVTAEDGSQGEGDPMQLAQDAAHNKANPLYEPLHDSSHPQHRAAKEKVEAWWKLAVSKKK